MHKYRNIVFIIVLFINLNSSGQDVSARFTPSGYDSLVMLESHINGQSELIIHSQDENEKLTCTFFMIKNLVRALKIKGSFQYPFDSIKYISLLKSPDNKFRVFTWHLDIPGQESRQYGVIQLNPEMLSKKERKKNPQLIFPLIDRSDSISRPEDTVTSNEFWFGSHYYSIIPSKIKKKDYYLLLGFDTWDKSANRKIIEVLWFDKGHPRFGAEIFDLENKEVKSRIVFEYDNEAVMTLRWLEDKKIIVFDHLVPRDGADPKLKKQYLPDGSFDYFKFTYGAWKQYARLKDFFIDSH